MTNAVDRRAAVELACEVRWFAGAGRGVPAGLHRRLLDLAAELERVASEMVEAAP